MKIHPKINECIEAIENVKNNFSDLTVDDLRELAKDLDDLRVHMISLTMLYPKP